MPIRIPWALHFVIVISTIEICSGSLLKQHSGASDSYSPTHPRSGNATASIPHLRRGSNAFLGTHTRKVSLLNLRGPSASFNYQHVGVVIFSLIALAIVVWLLFLLEEMYAKYQNACESIDDVDWSFQDYAVYQLGQWMTWTKDSSSILLVGVTACLFLIGTFAYWLVVPKAGIWHGAWMTYIWMVAPDGGIGEATFAGAACGAVLSICGLLIFALVLTLVQNWFDSWMRDLRAGRSGVMEVGHVLIIGLTRPTVHLIGELCKAYSRQGGVTLVVMLGDTLKQDMEDMIVEANMQMLGSKVVVRPGYPQYHDDLDIAAAHSCCSIIILADHTKDKEVRDAFVMQALLVLREKGWPQHGQIVAECSLQKNMPLLTDIGGAQTTLVMLEQFLAKMTLQVSQEPGLGEIIAHAFSFEGSEMYITDVPDIHVGRTLQDVGSYYPKAVVAGSIDANDEVRVGHCDDHILKKGEELILFCENSGDASHCTSKPYYVPAPLIEGVRTPPKLNFALSVEKILVVGWGAYIGALLVEIDRHVHKGTRIVIVSPKPENERTPYLERSQRRWQHKFVNISFDHVVGMLGSPTVWDRLPFAVGEFSRILLLADTSTPDGRTADSCTIAAAMHLRSLLSECPAPRVKIVPELRDPRSAYLTRMINLTDFLDSAGMPVQVLAALAYQPRLSSLMTSLVGDGGALRFVIRRLEDYLPEQQALPGRISFVEAQHIVAATGGVLVGWSERDEEMEQNKFVMLLETEIFQESHAETHIQWKFNPEQKTVERPWASCDRLAVLLSLPASDRTPRTPRTPRTADFAVNFA